MEILSERRRREWPLADREDLGQPRVNVVREDRWEVGDVDGDVGPRAEAARDWLQKEAENWLPALSRTAAEGEHQRVIDVAKSLHWFSDLWPNWGHWREVFTLSSHAADQLDDDHLRAVHLGYLAWAYTFCLDDVRWRTAPRRKRRYQETGTFTTVTTIVNDPQTAPPDHIARFEEMSAAWNTGLVHLELEQWEQAKALFDRALEMAEHLGLQKAPSETCRW